MSQLTDDIARVRWLSRAEGCATDELERVCAAAERAEKVEAFLACLLDKPEDRLYHAADKTWWRREGMHLKAADPPPEVEKAEAERDTALAETRRLREAATRIVAHWQVVAAPITAPGISTMGRLVSDLDMALSAEAPGAKEEADDR